MNRSCVLVALALVGAMLICLSDSVRSDEAGTAKKPQGTEGGTGPRRAGGGLGGGLLQIPEVQKDLQLTDEQKVQILALSIEMRGDRVGFSKRAEAMLKPEQVKRLKQIRLQVGGPAVLVAAEVASALELSEEQIRKLRAIQDEVRDSMRKIVLEGKELTADERRAIMPKLFERMEQIRKETTQKAIDVLTPKQRAIFEELQGPKINLDSRPVNAG